GPAAAASRLARAAQEGRQGRRDPDPADVPGARSASIGERCPAFALSVFSVLVVSSVVSCGQRGSDPVTTREFGAFQGAVTTRWLDDGRRMELLEDFVYVDPSGVRWNAPRTSKIDGASIPAPLWTFVGSPFTGCYRRASVVHDVGCHQRMKPWQD